MPRALSLTLILTLLTSPAFAEDPAPSDLPDMTGTWAQLQVTTAISSIPVIGDIITTTTTVLLVDVQQFKNDVFLTETACNIKITSNSSSIRTIVPTPFLKAVSGRTRQARIYRKGSDIHYYQKPKTTVLGARLSNVSRDKLPDNTSDRRVFDADGDGKPGVTIKVRGIIDGSLYLVQRGWNELKGTMKGVDNVQGSMKWSSEQQTVDATSIWLKSQPTSKKYKGKRHNYFRMRRVAKNATCTQILGQRRTLFSP